MEPLIALKCSNSRVISCALTVVERKLERSLTIKDTYNALLSRVHLFHAAANLALFWLYLGGAFPPQAPFRKSKRVLPFLPDRFSSQCSLWCLLRSYFSCNTNPIVFWQTQSKMGVTKEVIQEGSGPKPQKGQTITVHCTGYLTSPTQKKFWSTKVKLQNLY